MFEFCIYIIYTCLYLQMYVHGNVTFNCAKTVRRFRRVNLPASKISTSVWPDLLPLSAYHLCIVYKHEFEVNILKFNFFERIHVVLKLQFTFFIYMTK